MPSLSLPIGGSAPHPPHIDEDEAAVLQPRIYVMRVAAAPTAAPYRNAQLIARHHCTLGGGRRGADAAPHRTARLK